jgi:hypothetical protein
MHCWASLRLQPCRGGGGMGAELGEVIAQGDQRVRPGRRARRHLGDRGAPGTLVHRRVGIARSSGVSVRFA